MHDRKTPMRIWWQWAVAMGIACVLSRSRRRFAGVLHRHWNLLVCYADPGCFADFARLEDSNADLAMLGVDNVNCLCIAQTLYGRKTPMRIWRCWVSTTEAAKKVRRRSRAPQQQLKSNSSRRLHTGGGEQVRVARGRWHLAAIARLHYCHRLC